MHPKVLNFSDPQPSVVYLDNNATTRPLPEVVEAMVDILGPHFGNASSAHSGGGEARIVLAKARESCAELIGAEADQIVFTASGTEANNMAIRSCIRGSSSGGLLTTAIEHSSIVKTAEALSDEGTRVCVLAPTESGDIDAKDIVAALQEHQPDLVSVQWVNSETGVINPIQEIGEICHDFGVLFHTDAAQAVGKMRVDLRKLRIDFLTYTAHKFHGPAGVGVVYAKNSRLLSPLIYGGDQEGGVRAGTENLAGIVGTGVAADIRQSRLETLQAELQELRDYFETFLIDEFPWIQKNGGEGNRVSNTSNLLFSSVDGQALVAQFDAIGVQCSQSSACTNLRPEPSYVLRAMGLSEKEAYSSVRFSFGEENSHEEVADALTRMAPIIRRLREILY